MCYHAVLSAMLHCQITAADQIMSSTMSTPGGLTHRKTAAKLVTQLSAANDRKAFCLRSHLCSAVT